MIFYVEKRSQTYFHATLPPFFIATSRRSHCRPARCYGKPSSPPATIAATETIEGRCRTLLPSDLLHGEEGEGLTTTDSTPSSTSMRSSSAAVAVEDDPAQRGDDDAISGSESNQQSTNNGKWRGGGVGGIRSGQSRCSYSSVDSR